MKNVKAGHGRQWKDLENPAVRYTGREGEKQSRKALGVQPQWGMGLLLEAMDSLLHLHLYHSTNPQNHCPRKAPRWPGSIECHATFTHLGELPVGHKGG